jgi:hypothetical protein
MKALDIIADQAAECLKGRRSNRPLRSLKSIRKPR